MQSAVSGFVFSFIGLCALSGHVAAQDAIAGEELFSRCATCHEIGDDARNKAGPVLTGVVGRNAGSADGYNYSRSMLAANEAGIVWSEENLVAYLENPTKYLREVLDNTRARAKMQFKLPDETDRRNVVAWLATFSPAAPEGSASVCVTNGSDTERLFAAETGDGTRETMMLAPGDTLCTAGDGDGVVSVFEQPDHLEGCSRLTASGQTETLLRYAEFDRCAWGSNSG